MGRSKKPIEVYGKTVKEQISEIVHKPHEKFLTKSQKDYWNSLDENLITLCTGPAGTGKSYISILKSISLLCDDNNKFEKIVILRPIVTVGDRDVLGSLPGSLTEKMDPYVYPTFYLINKIIGREACLKLQASNFIEIMALSFCRGVNFDNCIVVFEEAQNATIDEMKMVLTRIGFNTKIFISGDLEQSDKFRIIENSGLYDAMKRLTGIKGIGEFNFKMTDIVRNKLISEILERYK